MKETVSKRQAKYDAVSFAPDAKVPAADKWCLGFTAFATTVPWVLFGYFLIYFYTDVIGMSGTLAGSLMMFARVFDAFTDLMIGWCIDHFNLKWGKYRSWLLFSVPIQFVLFVMVWLALPDTTSTLQMVIACVGYGCYGAIGSTLCFIPMNCSMTNIARNQDERATIVGLKGLTKNVGTLLAVVGFMPMVNFFGGGSQGFLIAGIIFGVITTAPVLWCFIMSKKYELNADGSYREHLRDTKEEGGDAVAEKISFGRQVKELIQNRPAMITVVSTFLLYIMDALRTGTVVFLYNYYFERPELSSIALFFNIAVAIVGALCIRYIIKLFKDSNRAYLMVMILNAAMNLIYFGIIFAVGRETAGKLMGIGQPLFIFYALCGFMQGAQAVFPDIMMPQAVDYGMWKYGRNQAGFVFACYGFCLTIGGAVGSGVLGFLLDAIGYSGTEAMGSGTLQGLLIVGIVVPAVMILVAALIQKFYGFSDKEHAKCVEEIAERNGEA